MSSYWSKNRRIRKFVSETLKACDQDAVMFGESSTSSNPNNMAKAQKVSSVCDPVEPSPDVSWSSHKCSRIIKSSKNWQQAKHWETQCMETTDHSDCEHTFRKRKRHPHVVCSPSPRCPYSGGDSPSPVPPRHQQGQSCSPPLKRHRHHPSSPPPLPPPKRSLSLVKPPPPSPVPELVTSTSSPLSPSPMRGELPPVPVDQSTASNMRLYFEAVLGQIEALRTEFRASRTEIADLKKEMMQALRQRKGWSEREESEGLSRPELPQGFSFPLSSREELQRLDQQLAADKAVQQRLEQYLYNLGGITYKHSLRAGGSALLTPSLQGQYNMTGTNRSGQNKANFSQLQQVNRVLFSAVQERHETTMQQMKTYLSDWLATWRDRVPGGKKQKTVVVVADSLAEANTEIMNDGS